MMKHETLSKPLPIGFNLRASRNNLPVAPAANSSKRSSLWRPRSSSEAPSSVPRSPITKAFDFLPWARNKKRSSSSEKAAAAAPIAPTANARNTANSSSSSSNTTANTVVSRTNADGYKNHCIPYNRNIFRNSGGIMRDILSDKLNKEKQGSGTLPNPHKRCNQRRPKGVVVGRNQSLDINELIDCVENELVADKKKTASNRFLDDTFIDKIIRVKDENHRSGRNTAQEQEHDEDYMYSNYSYGDDVNEYDYEDDYKKSYAHEDTHRNNNNNNMNGHLASSSKHILFNDENVVYLIKNELPVKRDAGKNKMALQKSTKVVSAAEKERSKLERETNVLRARLKFKKLPATEGAPLAEQKSQLMNNQLQQYDKHDHQQRNNSQPSSKSSLIDKFASIGLDSFNFGSGSGEKSVKRGILQRQNTLPAAPPSHRSIDVSPELNKRHHQLYQRKEQRNAIQRRKSLTDTSYVPFTGPVDNSSSSSMGSGVGAVSGGGGIISDRPKTDKPRKKLSFREPVVSEKTKTRRLSIPLNHVHSSNTTEDTNGNRASSGRGVANVSHDLNKRADNRGGHKAELADRDRNTDAESQAMRIVRTVGQAFEVCHKFNLHKNSLDNNDERSDVSSDLLDVEHISEPQLSEEDIAKKDQSGGGGGGMTPDLNPPQRPNHLELLSQSNLSIRKSPSAMSDEDKSPTTPSSPSREVHKLKDQLEQQALQTRQALAQLMLVREQLISETNARIEAQARTQQLLQQNRELLEHLASLGVYTEQQTPGLTTANIAMAPQSQLQMLLQATSNSNNLATINQQINNLGSINQQLTSLSHQLSGLNQQSQNLQNLQNISANLQQQQQHQQQQQQHQQQHHQHQHHLQQPQSLTNLTSPASSTSFHQPPPPSPLHLNVSASNASSNTGTLSSSPFPSMNHLQSISSQLQSMSVQNSQQQQQDALSKDLLQVNQELLNRLQALNLSTGSHVASTSTGIALNGSPLPHTQQTPSPHSSFFFVNPMSCSPSNNNNSASNFNFLGSPGGGMGGGNLTPSPMSTLNRSSYSHSPINDELGLSIDRSLNSLDERGLQKTLGHLCSTASNGNIAVCSSAGTRENSRSSSTIESPTSPNSRNSNGNGNGSCEPRFNTVTLKVTDEAGNVTNQRKLSATPSFITRSTSEKVPNRSQMMSQVQRTAWARHTTK